MLSALPSILNTPALPPAATDSAAAAERGAGFAELMQRQTELQRTAQRSTEPVPAAPAQASIRPSTPAARAFSAWRRVVTS